jgi:serine-type D-Ala-D-Ala carboxypeptidase (penicillin-binding protein 5/6)
MNDFLNEEKQDKLSRREFLTLLMVIVVTATFATFKMIEDTKRDKLVEDSEEILLVRNNKIFENLSLESKAVFVWDIRDQKEIFSYNSESQIPLASLTKVLMAVTALDKVPEGTIITIRGEDLESEGDSGLFANESWTLGELIEFSLVVSSNDGARAIASAIGSQVSDSGDGVEEFVKLMNIKAREIGLAQTYFTSPSGLDIKDIIPGGTGSAHDIATLFEYTLKEFPGVLEATSYATLDFNSLNKFEHEAENTNGLVSKLPGIIASKTGFTDLAGGNLVVVFEPEPGHPIVLVALGSTIDGRFLDIEKLYLTTLDYLNP